MKNLMLIGASGHGKIVADIAEHNNYSNISFLDRDYPQKAKNGIWSVVGKPTKETLNIAKNTDFFISIGNNKIREQLALELNLIDSPIFTHSSAIVSQHANIEQGTLLVAGSIINIGASIGRFVIINTGASIDHDCEIGDFVHISPGARLAGGINVGTRTWIGIGASVCENINIGKDVIIGAGAVVIDDIADGTTVVGNPAKPIKGSQ